MKTFAKIVLILVALVVLLKLLPLTLGLGIICAVLAGLALLAGLGLVGVMLVAALTLVAALSPLWLPVVVGLGIWALVKKVRRA